MADKKTTDLPELTSSESTDVLIVVDTSESDVNKKTKKIIKKNLMGSPGPVGDISPDSGTFTKINLSNVQINKFTTDENLVESDTSVPTEKAVKKYVDKAIIDLKLKTITSTTVAVKGDVILADSSGGDIDILLTPALNGKIIVKKISSDSNKVTVTVAGSGTIDGETMLIIETPYNAYIFISDEVNFYII